MSSENKTTFHFGDGDLRFLGMMAALAARFQARRSGGRIRVPGSQHSGVDAMDLLAEGMLIGRRVPIDDVPELRIVVEGDRDAIHRLRQLETGAGIQTSYDVDESDDAES